MLKSKNKCHFVIQILKVSETKVQGFFGFEQLLFNKVNKLTCKGQVGLGLDGKGWWRANTGSNQLSDAIGHSHATSIKIEGCPCKLWQPYWTVNLNFSWGIFHQISLDSGRKLI